MGISTPHRLAGLAALVLALSTLTGSARAADSWSTSGSLSLDLRWFVQSAAFPDQLEGVQASATLSPELRWRSSEGKHRLEIVAFGRYDAEDDERTHYDLREGAYRYLDDRFELLVGVSRVFWGVTESRHLVDVVNQTDFVEDVDEEDKLGQPMLRLSLDRDWGRLELYSLLGFRERTFPGLRGRLRPPLPVDTDLAAYESSAEQERIDLVIRWSQFVGSWDLGAYLFHGTGREPRLLPAADENRLRPFYDTTSQLGLDLQHTRGAWLWKVEALAREGQGRTFGAAVAGFERTFYQLGEGSADLGLLAELLWDDRDSAAPATIYDNDVFVGLRLAANDVRDSEILAGAIVDVDDQSIFGLIEGRRRVGRSLALELEARVFANTDPTGDLAAVDRDSFVNLRAAWYW